MYMYQPVHCSVQLQLFDINEPTGMVIGQWTIKLSWMIFFIKIFLNMENNLESHN